MKYIILVCSLLFFSLSEISAQELIKATFGEPTPEDFAYTTYEKDPDVKAVVLFEKGDISVKVIKRSLRLVKNVHVKIKVLETTDFDGATIEIPFYQAQKAKEKVTKIKALTHNGAFKKYVNEDAIYTKNTSEKWAVKSFTFPDVKVGSILEYQYTLETPFFQSYDWEFQGDYPKLYSEFRSEIPGNYIYRIALVGTKKLDYKDSSIKGECFYVESVGGLGADCMVNTYVMRAVPVFTEEDFMLSRNNYISKVKYELKSSISFEGQRSDYTKTWKDVDREFRYDKEMGKQLKHTSYFEKNLPQAILSIADDLERAQAVYYFIQNHFSWNNQYRIFNDIRVKDAFEEKVGNIAEINLSLINALRAAKLDAELALSATRGLGLPTQLYPVMSDFNYVMAFLTIGEKEWYLDATDSYTDFGYLPLRALNTIGRVMDFKNGSSWKNITPNKKNVQYVKVKLKLDEDEMITGKVEEERIGHLARIKRTELKNTSKESYLNRKQSLTDYFEIREYTAMHVDSIQNNLKEKYAVEMESQIIGDDIYFNPYFLMEHFTENPFTLDERTYPVEMGYPMQITYMLSLDIPENYTFKTVPENRAIRLPNNLGVCTVNYATSDKGVHLRLSLKLSQYVYGPEYYPALKEFFTKVVEVRSKAPIVLEKL